MNKLRSTGERAHILARHFDFDHVDGGLEQAVDGDKLHKNARGHREDVHLEHFAQLELECRPLHQRCF